MSLADSPSSGPTEHELAQGVLDALRRWGRPDCVSCGQSIEGITVENHFAEVYQFGPATTKVPTGKTVYSIPCGCVLTPAEVTQLEEEGLL